jgi:cob(I)alamin adenosyltransferase
MMGNRLTKIVTKKGDGGKTSFGGGCNLIEKDHSAIELLGDIDELNSFIGLAANSGCDDLAPTLAAVQQNLFNIGADVYMNGKMTTFNPQEIQNIEGLISSMNEALPPLKEFVLPGGPSASLHVARAVCRRAERHAFKYLRTVGGDKPIYVVYLNRLSDLLFVMARMVSFKANDVEVLWNSRKLSNN